MKNKPLYLYVLNILPVFARLHDEAEKINNVLTWETLRFVYLCAVTNTLIHPKNRSFFKISREEFQEKCMYERSTLWINIDAVAFS